MKNSLKYLILSLWVFFLSILYAFYNIPAAEAHLAGQPPFFKVNGKYAGLYAVPLTSLYDFDLPQDQPPDNYLINQLINFEFDISRLPAPPEVVAKTKFIWDFGDETKGEGLKNSHTYHKIGSFILKVYADDSSTPKPQLLESVLLNILPDPNYQLPKAKILINGTGSKDPLTDILKLNLKDDVSFDASKSTSANKLTYYFWDFGDQKSAQGSTQIHHYQTDLPQIFVVLRVKDNNGFIADQFVELQDSKTSTPSTLPTTKAGVKKESNHLIQISGALVLIIILIFTVRLFFRGPRRGKYR